MDANPKHTSRLQAAQWLPFGAVKPSGWIRAQMQHDLEHGFVGHLDELVPDLILRDDIYGADRLTKAAKTKELGVLAKESQWEVQFLWWNSETQSNWLDGMMRTALLVENSVFIHKARARIEHLLATQDADGYLGIYAPDLRFNFTGENGELWAQATLFRVLFGWHEATGDECALAAVRRAVEVTMAAYPMGQSHPFEVKNDFAGVGHGLAFTDILDRLHQLTGETCYLNYARWLYLEYSRQPISQDDLQLAHLLDPEYRFKAHGVHTYEHFRSLLTAAYAADDPQLDSALAAALAKLETCLTPSGGPIGDEFIAGREADAGETGYEYCSIHELLDTYTHLLQKTGDLRWADRAEWLFFNAAQGARHPDQPTIAYLKTDNSTSMTGPFHPDDPQDPVNPQIRYKYSPAHQDVAVCCVPNAGRLFPYYVKSMWLRGPLGLVCMLYGASELCTEVHGSKVRIVQETDYPFCLEVTFTLHVSHPIEFELAFRKPEWASGFQLTGANNWHEENGMIILKQVWHGGERIGLRFETAGRCVDFQKNEAYFRYGPLLYCLPLEGVEKTGRQYPMAGFHDLLYFPATQPEIDYQIVGKAPILLEPRSFDPQNPWRSFPSLVCELFDLIQSSTKTVRLVPMGASILRRVTFKHHIPD